MKLRAPFVLVVFSVTLLFCPSGLCAQSRPFAAKGTVEFGGSFSFATLTAVSNGVSLDNSSITMLNIAPMFAYFLADNVAVGISPGLSFLNYSGGITSLSGGSAHQTQIQYFATAAYHIPLQVGTEGKSTAFPFAEVQFGPTSVDFSGGNGISGLSWALRGGIKIVPTEHVLATVGVTYTMITLNHTGATTRSGYNLIAIGVGLSGYL